jgi:flavin reductase (DIM6/NTAB) family NADH-FMN oxidoreductase RutF
VAWVSTVGADGSRNLAPFSCYSFVATKPPMISLSLARLASGPKDTLRNILQTGEFVVNVPQQSMAAAVTATAAELPPEASEWDIVQVTAAPCEIVRPSRIAECPVAMECRLHQFLELGESRHTLVIGEVLLFHIDDRYYRDGEVDVRLLQPLGRLSGDLFTGPGEIFEVKRGRS